MHTIKTLLANFTFFFHSTAFLWKSCTGPVCWGDRWDGGPSFAQFYNCRVAGGGRAPPLRFSPRNSTKPVESWC